MPTKIQPELSPSEAASANAHKKSLALDSLLLIVLVGLAVRLIVVVFIYPGELNPRRDHWPFGYETGRIARALALHQGFSNPLFSNSGPTAWMAPVYPYLLAGVFRLFGIFTKVSAIVMLCLQSIFSALTCVPLVFIARRTFGPATAVWVGWAWALFPYAIFISAGMIWETSLTTLLMTLLFLLTFNLERSPRLQTWLVYGLLWGLAALTSPAVLAVLPFLGLWACYRLRRSGRRWGLPAAAGALTLVATVTPWFIRNYRTFHKFIPFRDDFGLELHVGNHGDASHWDADSGHPSHSDAELEEFNRLGELRYMAEKRREALEYIRNHPGLSAWMTMRRIEFFWAGFWSLNRNYLADEPFDPVNIVFRTGLTVLALLGLRRAFQDGIPAAVPCALVCASFPLVYYVTIPEMRYRHPIDPVVVLLAVYGVTRWRSLNIRIERLGARSPESGVLSEHRIHRRASALDCLQNWPAR
jgi:dolichyl-phosphate-mannose-protein mannosyltransferase